MLVAPPPALCTDNGAMIAWAGAERLALGLTDPLDTAPRARWPLDEVAGPQTAKPVRPPQAAAPVDMSLRAHRSARRRRLGHRARQRRRARRPQRHAVGARCGQRARSLRATRESRLLPACSSTTRIAVTRDLAEAARAEAILLVVPAQAMRSVVHGAGRSDRRPARRSIACAKGIEHGTRKFMTEIIAECAPNAMPAILSGPSFAADVARGLPTAVTLAAHDEALAAALAQALGSRSVPALSLDRRARRRDRRRGQERAGDRRRHRHRPRARRQRVGGADHARLCRAGPLRPGLRRARPRR